MYTRRENVHGEASCSPESVSPIQLVRELVLIQHRLCTEFEEEARELCIYEEHDQILARV